MFSTNPSPVSTTTTSTIFNPTFTFSSPNASQAWTSFVSSSSSQSFPFGTGVQNTSTIQPFGNSHISTNFTPTNISGTSIFGTNQTGTVPHPASNFIGTTVKFAAVSAQEIVHSKGKRDVTIYVKFQCICVMKEYLSKSMEELRMEDYQTNQKFPLASFIGTTPITSTTTTTPVFPGFYPSVPATSATHIFGMPPTTTATPAFPGFNPTVPTTSATNIFGVPKSTTTPVFPGFYPTAPAITTSSAFPGFNPTVPTSTATHIFGMPPTTTTTTPTFLGFNPTVPTTSATNIFGVPKSTTTTTPAFPGFSSTAPATTTRPVFSGFNPTVPTSTATNIFCVLKSTTTTTPAFSGFNPTAPATNTTSAFPGFNPAVPISTATNIFGMPTTTTTTPAFPGFNPTVPTTTASAFPGFNPTLPTTTTPAFPGFNPTVPTTIASTFNPQLFQPLSATQIHPIVTSSYSSPVVSQASEKHSISVIQQQLLLDPYANRGRKDFTNINQTQIPPESIIVPTLTTLIPAILPLQSNSPRVSSSRTSIDVNFKLKPVSSSPTFLDDIKSSQHQQSTSPIGHVKSTLTGSFTNEEEMILLSRTKMSKLRLSNQPDTIRSLYPLRRLDELEKFTNIIPSISPIISRKSNYNSTTDHLPILTRQHYFTKPNLTELKSLFNDKGQCILKQFTVGHQKYGSVTFHGEINVAGLNLDAIIEINRHEVIVYPDDDNKPPVGEELNLPARIILLGIYPIDRTTQEEITDIKRIKLLKYDDYLHGITKKFDGEFIDYGADDGSWIFMVKHFTRYGLDNNQDGISSSVEYDEIVVV